MNVIFELFRMSLKNRVRGFFKNIRRPRYFVPVIAIGLWLGLMVFSQVMQQHSKTDHAEQRAEYEQRVAENERRLAEASEPERHALNLQLESDRLLLEHYQEDKEFSFFAQPEHSQTLAALFLLVFFASSWTKRHKAVFILVPESELESLFALPLSQRQILLLGHMKMLAVLTITGVLMTVLINTPAGVIGHIALGLTAMALFLAMFSNRIVAAQVTLALRRRRLEYLKFLVPAALILPLLLNLQPVPPGSDYKAIVGVIHDSTSSGVAAVVMWPMRAVSGALVGDVGAAVMGLGIAALIAAVFAFLALANRENLREVLLAGGQKLSMRMRSARTQGNAFGGPTQKRVKQSRFALSPHGPIWRAVAWKQAMGVFRGGAKGPIIMMLIMSVNAVAFGFISAKELHLQFPDLIAGFGLVLGGVGMFMGPLTNYADLRTNLRRADVLRSLPVSAKDVFRGEALGGMIQFLPVSLGLMAIFCVLGALLVPFAPDSFMVEDPQLAAAIFCSVLFLGPTTAWAATAWLNFCACWMPAWMVVPDGSDAEKVQGIENLGRGMVQMMLASLGFLAFGLVPAAVGVTLMVLFVNLMGSTGAIFGALLWAGLLVVVTELIIHLGAKIYAKLDVDLEGLVQS